MLFRYSVWTWSTTGRSRILIQITVFRNPDLISNFINHGSIAARKVRKFHFGLCLRVTVITDRSLNSDTEWCSCRWEWSKKFSELFTWSADSKSGKGVLDWENNVRHGACYSSNLLPVPATGVRFWMLPLREIGRSELTTFSCLARWGGFIKTCHWDLWLGNVTLFYQSCSLTFI